MVEYNIARVLSRVNKAGAVKLKKDWQRVGSLSPSCGGAGRAILLNPGLDLQKPFQRMKKPRAGADCSRPRYKSLRGVPEKHSRPSPLRVFHASDSEMMSLASISTAVRHGFWIGSRQWQLCFPVLSNLTCVGRLNLNKRPIEKSTTTEPLLCSWFMSQKNNELSIGSLYRGVSSKVLHTSYRRKSGMARHCLYFGGVEYRLDLTKERHIAFYRWDARFI